MTPLPFSEFQARILAVYQGPAHAASTAKKMEFVLRLVAGLGVQSTKDLTTATAARFVAERSRTVCANTVRGDLGYLQAAVEFAIDEGWLDRTPRWRRVRPRPSPPARKTLHSIEDVRRVLEYLRARAADWEWHRLYALVALIAYTGVRRDEALRARVEDVRLDRRTVVISARRRLKTEAAAAPVPICPELAAILADWLPRTGGPWLFPGIRNRGPWTGGDHFSRPIDSLKRAGRALGIEGLTFHSLRHTFATWARRRWGLTGLQLRDVLRHTTEHTQEHYVHDELDDEALVASVGRVSYAGW